MITQEQAEHAFYARYLQPQSSSKPEIRHVQFEQVDTATIELDDDIGPFDLQEQGWKCTFEIRYRRLHLGEWTGDYSEWRKKTCYIVEPEPGPYVLD